MPPRLALAAACSIAVVAAAALAPGERAGASPPEKFTRLPARGIGPPRPCRRQPRRLRPGRAPTFVYRLQHPWDVERLARMRAIWPERMPVKLRDLFLVRARSYGAPLANRMIGGLTDASLLSGDLFGCNRIIAMTGVHLGEGNPDEWAYNQLGNARVWSVAPDWERKIFIAGWPDTPGPDASDPEPEWTGNMATNAARIRRTVGRIRNAGKVAGVVATAWRGTWNYADLARRSRTAYQLLQTQSVCRKYPRRFGPRAADLVRQFHKAGMSTRSMALQVSFSRHPRRTPFRNDTVPPQAARCTAAAYRAGVRTFLLWGPPDSLDEYFAALPRRVRDDGCTIRGGRRRNVLRGTPGRDIICGLGGNDTLIGRAGKDVLVGGRGNDILRGGKGGDRLKGGPGDDVLDGGVSYDICIGGPGRDRLRIGCDRIPPRLTSVSVGPPDGGSVTVTARISDDLAGIAPLSRAAVFTFRGPSGTQTVDLALDPAALVSGVRTAGLFSATVALPAGLEPGNWQLESAAVWDQAGNGLSLGPDDLAAAGISASFTVPAEGSA